MALLPLGHELRSPVSRKVRDWEGSGARQSMGLGGGGGAPHQATAGCHPPGLTQCPVSSAWSLLCLRRSVLHWDHVSEDTAWYKVCVGGAKKQIGQLFYSLLMGALPNLWQRCVRPPPHTQCHVGAKLPSLQAGPLWSRPGG